MILEIAFLAAPSLLAIMLLPTLIELRKPKDSGPRLITYSLNSSTTISMVKPHSIVNVEETHQLDVTLKPFLHVIFSTFSRLEVTVG